MKVIRFEQYRNAELVKSFTTHCPDSWSLRDVIINRNFPIDERYYYKEIKE